MSAFSDPPAGICAPALAGAGVDKTEITLVADPKAKNNVGKVEAAGVFGRLLVFLLDCFRCFAERHGGA